MKILILLIAIASVSCQDDYFILTDEIDNRCDCVKFAISIAYNNGGVLKDIIESGDNEASVDNTGCQVLYVDNQGTFSDGDNFDLVDERCVGIDDKNFLSEIYNYTNTAANIVTDFSNIDTSKYSKFLDNVCNENTDASAPSPASEQISTSSPTDSSAPSPASEHINKSSPTESSASTVVPSPAPTVVSNPSPTVVPSPAPAQSSATRKAKPILAWIITFFMVALLFIGSSYGEIIVVRPVSICSESGPSGGGGTTEQSSTTITSAQESAKLGGV